MSRQAAEARGRWAETVEANFLRLKGWTILDRRVRTPAGEIDIVMRRPGLVAFVNRCLTQRRANFLQRGN